MEVYFAILREVRDPREENARHRLSDILFLALAATLCGSKTCVDIADFAAAHEDHFTDWIDLPHGAPSHDTFSRVFRLLEHEALERVLMAFLAAMRQGLGLPPPSGVVAVDGKALKRGYERGKAHVPPMMIGLWDSQTRLALASGRVGLNESADAVDLLRSLSLKGCTVTADALHCHPAFAEAVVSAKADYVLTLKGNNAPLRALADEAFRQASDKGSGVLSSETGGTGQDNTGHDNTGHDNTGHDNTGHDNTGHDNTGHDRVERRKAIVIAVGPHHPARHKLPGLKAFGRINAERTLHGQPTTHVERTFALSTVLTPARLIETVREHWSIENNLHWVLDVVFDEDRARTRKDHAPENLAVIRRIAINILNAKPEKISPARKMKKANWSKDYFFSLFTHMR